MLALVLFYKDVDKKKNKWNNNNLCGLFPCAFSAYLTRNINQIQRRASVITCTACNIVFQKFIYPNAPKCTDQLLYFLKQHWIQYMTVFSGATTFKCTKYPVFCQFFFSLISNNFKVMSHHTLQISLRTRGCNAPSHNPFCIISWGKQT